MPPLPMYDPYAAPLPGQEEDRSAALLHVTIQGVVVCASAASLDLFGYQPSDLVGRRITMLESREAPGHLARLLEVRGGHLGG